MSSWAVSLSPACRAVSSSADNRLEGSEGPSLALPLGAAGAQALGLGGFHEHSWDLIHCQLPSRPHLRHSPPWECDFTMLCFPGPGNSASASSRCSLESELLAWIYQTIQLIYLELIWDHWVYAAMEGGIERKIIGDNMLNYGINLNWATASWSFHHSMVSHSWWGGRRSTCQPHPGN